TAAFCFAGGYDCGGVLFETHACKSVGFEKSTFLRRKTCVCVCVCVCVSPHAHLHCHCRRAAVNRYGAATGETCGQQHTTQESMQAFGCWLVFARPRRHKSTEMLYHLHNKRTQMLWHPFFFFFFSTHVAVGSKRCLGGCALAAFVLAGTKVSTLERHAPMNVSNSSVQN
ncbi:MAG: hypothetical protein ORN28_03015, partial [Rhodoferax sp.]|nr:hypothetical protein [Rhodoferax sp.]